VGPRAWRGAEIRLGLWLLGDLGKADSVTRGCNGGAEQTLQLPALSAIAIGSGKVEEKEQNASTVEP